MPMLVARHYGPSFNSYQIASVLGITAQTLPQFTAQQFTTLQQRLARDRSAQVGNSTVIQSLQLRVNQIIQRSARAQSTFGVLNQYMLQSLAIAQSTYHAMAVQRGITQHNAQEHEYLSSAQNIIQRLIISSKELMRQIEYNYEVLKARIGLLSLNAPQDNLAIVYFQANAQFPELRDTDLVINDMENSLFQVERNLAEARAKAEEVERFYNRKLHELSNSSPSVSLNLKSGL